MIRCDKCGDKIDLTAGIFTDDWVEIMQLLPSFGGSSRLVFEYIELHGVFPLQKKSKKILRLLNDISRLFNSEKFRFGRAEYKISKAGISEALMIVCNKKMTDLDGHNYLKKVMISISDRERKDARYAEDKALREKEKSHFNGHRPTLPDTDELKSFSEFKKSQGIENLANLAGKVGQKI
jgi:hypothetical protein